MPLLWGAWRCTADPRLWVADCQACGGQLWVHRNGYEDWRASCENGCSREEIEAGAQRALWAQCEALEAQREARGAMDPSDPFYGVAATSYIHRLTGQEPTRGFFRCPFHGDGHERTPSLKAHDTLWFCHACQRGGTIYDFAGLLWNLEPRGRGFNEIREQLAREFLGVAWPTS